MKRIHLIAAVSCAFFGSVQAKTLYTGDSIQGVAVISQLDVSDLKTGQHRFMFKGAETQTGQNWYVPVMVAKGKKDGKNVLVQAGVHGDELNGVSVIQKLFSSLDPKNMQGAVVGVIGPNRSGIEQTSRYWHVGTSGGYTVDFNRIFPGKEFGNPPERQAWLLWEKLYNNNIDVALDYHTQSTGHTFPLFIYADYRNKEVQTIAELIPADQIKKDPGEKGTVETTFIENGITAITVELGNPRNYDQSIISRTLEGTKNILVHYGVIKGKIGKTAKTQNTFIGNATHGIKSTTGGFADILVNVGDKVKKNQLVAIQRNAFGDVIKEYKSAKNGIVLSTASDASRESNATLVRVLLKDSRKECQNGC